MHDAGLFLGTPRTSYYSYILLLSVFNEWVSPSLVYVKLYLTGNLIYFWDIHYLIMCLCNDVYRDPGTLVDLYQFFSDNECLKDFTSRLLLKIVNRIRTMKIIRAISSPSIWIIDIDDLLMLTNINNSEDTYISLLIQLPHILWQISLKWFIVPLYL